MKKTSKSFEYSYEEGTDSMRIACVEDYQGDFIIYAPVVNARDYKSKPITQAAVFMAFRKAVELGGAVAGPKKPGTFGASYLYPVFVRIGVIGMSHAGADHERTESTLFSAFKRSAAVR